ncbi:hypothetical protein N7470_009320 [Penicillium chermesinum]|nr:hypothetical protein N7470_009320 [Penicillium chermesinum]
MSSAVRRRQKRADVFEFISQPCGPRKLAKTLEICSRRQERRFDLMHENGAASKVQVRGPISSTPRELDRPLPLPLDIQEPLRQVVQVQATDQPSEPLETLLEVNTPASEDESQPLEPEKSQTVKTPSTVLIVDDNDINVRLLVAFMKRLGIQNLVARNGQEALHCFKKKASEIMIILMDISMPIMDGLEATRRIRKVERMMEGKERTFICALTGVAQTDTEREAFGSGMDMFLTKPVRLNTLRPLIDERIHRSRYD